MRRLLPAAFALFATPAAAQDDPAVMAARLALLDGRSEASLPVIEAAAEAGDARAQNLMGYAAERGLGLPRDMAAALAWYQRAADQGHPRALHNLGWLHRYGTEGVEPDPVLARAEFARAAAMDYPPSLAEYGDMLIRGLGGPRDRELGLGYLRMGATLGDSDAMQWLAANLLLEEWTPESLADVRRLLEASAAQGNWTAQANLGHLLMQGWLGEPDPEGAAALFRAGMASGFDLAGYHMAELIAGHPSVDPRPLAAPAHCLWALRHATRVAVTDRPWDCGAHLDGLAEADLRAAEAMVGDLAAP